MSYPEFVEVDGVQFKLNTDYRDDIRCFGVINDDSITDSERAYAVMLILIDDIPKVNHNKLLKVLQKYLSRGKQNENKEDVKPDMDFEQDEGYIASSFMFDYGIDLSSSEPLHYWRFVDLLDGLSSDCALNRIREVRTCDLSDYKGKAKTKMSKAKEAFALKVKVSDEDQKALEAFDKLFETTATQTQTNALEEGDYLIEDDQ